MFIPSTNFPSHDMLVTMLMAERHCLIGGTIRVWLCIDETRCEIVRDKRKLFGIYKRGVIGKGDSNGALANLAHEMLDAIADVYMNGGVQ